MKTALAVIAAIALIGGALFVRAEFIEGDADPGGAVAGDGTETAVPDGDVRVACDAALGEGCPAGSDRLGLADMLTAFQGRAAAYDVVVAPSVVIDLIEGSQTSQVRFQAEREVLATTPLLFAIAPARAQALIEACGAEVTWACLAGLVEARQLTPGLADPTRDTVGIAGAAALTGGFLGSPTYATNAFGGAGFLGWLSALTSETQVSAAPLDRLIQFGGAQNDGAVVLEATGLATIGRAAQNVPEHHWPTPLAHLAVVAVGVGGTDGGDVDDAGEAAAQALAAAGWRGPDGAPVVDGPPLTDDDGLPSGGVLFALRQRWN